MFFCLCLTSDPFIPERLGIFRSSNCIHNWGWLIVITHYFQMYDFGKICEITLLYPSYCNSLYEWFLDLLLQTSNMHNATFIQVICVQSSSIESKVAVKAERCLTLAICPYKPGSGTLHMWRPTLLHWHFRVLPCLVCKKWYWNEPCLKTQTFWQDTYSSPASFM